MGLLRAWAAAVAAVCALLLPAGAGAQELEQIGSFERPVFVGSDPGDANRLFVVEQAGRVRLVEGDQITTFLDIEPLVHELTPYGDFGLLSIAFSPGPAGDRLLYVLYTAADDPATGGEDESGDWVIDEYRANRSIADPSSRREVLSIDYPNQQLHYGGQMQFGPDGYLYASTGDGAQGDPAGNAQNLATLWGKILRIDPAGSAPGEYSVPPDNPFAGTGGCGDGCDEIWSLGLRNPWRFSFDRLTGDMTVADVGHDAFDEVDFDNAPDAGRALNYGWNCREGAHPGRGAATQSCLDSDGAFAEPALDYPHDDSAPCTSITGGYVVRDGALGPLSGRYLYSDFCVGELRSVRLPDAGSDRSEGLFVANPTSFGEDAQCRIYVASFTGPVYRFTPENGAPSAGCDSAPAAEGGRALRLKLGAKKQELDGKLTFVATASADATMVATGGAIAKARRSLAKGRRTRVTVRVNAVHRRQIQRRLARNGGGKVAIRAVARDGRGAPATGTVTIPVKRQPLR